MRKFCTGAQDLAWANIVAVKAGFWRFDESHADVENCGPATDGEDYECEGCHGLIMPGANLFWKEGSPEYPADGSWYGSPACRAFSWSFYPGTIEWFLERQGWIQALACLGDDEWTLFDRDPDDECGIGDVIANGRIGDKQGPGPTFRKHLALARKLAKQFRELRRLEAAHG